MFEGLLTARQYFNRNNDVEIRIRAIIDTLWNEAEWTWFTQGRNVLYWHWSPNYGFEMNHEIRGYNECLITYILAAAAPKYSDDMTVDEILSLMTEEEAAELVVTTGVNKGWTMAQVSEQRPSSLKYYAYLCEDCGNIMKAAAMLLMGGSQQLKAS